MVFGAAAGNGRLCLGSQGLLHGGGHIGLRLKAASADAGADGRPDIRRVAAELPSHGLHRPGSNPGRRPPPPGVSRSHRLADRVIKQNGGAIGGKNRQGHPRLIRHKAVPFRLHRAEQSLPPVFPAHPGHNIRMGLPGKHRLLGGKAHGLPQDLVVSQHPLRLVAPVNAQIQAGQAPGAHAPQPGGEAMRRILEKPAPDILQSAPCYNFKFQSDSFPKRARSPAEAPCLSPEGIGAWRPAFQVLITRSPGRVQPPGPRGARGGAVMPVPQQCPCPGSIFCTFCHCRRGRGRWGLPFWPYAPAAASRSCRWR